MPLGAIVGGISSFFANKAQRSAEDRQRAWNEKMYEKQYQDNIKLWQMQNEYNDPSAQMERLQKAGLNPNLVYGKGAGGNSAGVPTGADVKSLDTKAPNWQGLAQALSVAHDIRLKKAQADNVEQNTVNAASDDLFKWYQETGLFKDRGKKRFRVPSFRTDKMPDGSSYKLRLEQTAAQRLENAKRAAYSKYWDAMAESESTKLRLDNLLKDFQVMG